MSTILGVAIKDCDEGGIVQVAGIEVGRLWGVPIVCGDFSQDSYVIHPKHHWAVARLFHVTKVKKDQLKFDDIVLEAVEYTIHLDGAAWKADFTVSSDDVLTLDKLAEARRQLGKQTNFTTEKCARASETLTELARRVLPP